MNEIKEKRTLNTKYFLRADGSFQMDAHVGHIHYFDKIGGTGMRGIDWTLNFDEVRRGWYFNFHSFQPFIPEFADQWVVFRDLFQDKDQSVKYRAHSYHTKGRLVMPSEIGMEKQTDQNCVIYDNAFGEGLDYIIYFTRSTMKKVVRIRDGYKASTDMRFSWDIVLPEEKNAFRTENKEKIGTDDSYELDITRSKTFDTRKHTLIGSDKLDGKEWYTYLRDFKCWDSGNMDTYHEQGISVEYNATENTLTKIIPTEFLNKSVGDVFSDTTTSYYSGAGDGCVGFERPTTGTWSYIHDAATAAYQYSSGTLFQTTGGSEGAGIGSGDWGAGLALNRAFVPMDTSGLDDGATITAASLFLYVYAHYTTGELTGYHYYSVVETNQASNTSLSTGDYDECGKSTANGWSSAMSTDIIKLSGDVSSSLTDSAYNEFALNSTGLAVISKTGYTKLGVRNAHDLMNVSQNTGAGNYAFFHAYTSEQTGTSNDPYLSVTYTISSTVNSNFFALM